MALVQPESGHQPASHLAGDGAPGTADTMAHGTHGLQEPPPADHLFADAQIDHGGAQGAGGDTHAATAHADLPAIAPAPEPLAVEHRDHGHSGV